MNETLLLQGLDSLSQQRRDTSQARPSPRLWRGESTRQMAENIIDIFVLKSDLQFLLWDPWELRICINWRPSLSVTGPRPNTTIVFYISQTRWRLRTLRSCKSGRVWRGDEWSDNIVRLWLGLNVCPRQILNWFVAEMILIFSEWRGGKWVSINVWRGSSDLWWRRQNISILMSVMISGDMLPSPGGDHIPGSAPTSDNSLVNTDSQYQHLAPVIRHTGVISNGGLRSGARSGD